VVSPPPLGSRTHLGTIIPAKSSVPCAKFLLNPPSSCALDYFFIPYCQCWSIRLELCLPPGNVFPVITINTGCVDLPLQSTPLLRSIPSVEILPCLRHFLAFHPVLAIFTSSFPDLCLFRPSLLAELIRESFRSLQAPFRPRPNFVLIPWPPSLSLSLLLP